MALLANQLMDARVLSGMNGRVELPQFLRVVNQGIVSQASPAHDDDTRKNRKYPCPLCGKRFRFNSILSLHMRTHTGEKPFKCPYCDHRAAQKGNLKIHLRTHKQGILGKGRGRIREENRLLHELEERAILRDRQLRGGLVGQLQPPHVTQPQQNQLPPPAPAHPQLSLTPSGPVETQPQTSTSPKTTAVHDELAQPQPTGFRCSFCKGKFRKQQELERHIRILHKPYKCTLCEFAASQEEELIGHVETAHITAESASGQKPASGAGDKVKPVGEFPCEVCGQTFSQAWFLKGHMRKHKDSFEHCCQICGRRFKEPWFLKNHMKVHLNKLAAKSKLPAERDATVNMTNLTQDPQTNLYSQYISSIHSRFLTAERAGQPDYNQILATAGVEMKVREMLGRMMTSGQGSLNEGESPSLMGLNHLLPPLSSSTIEYLQAVIADRDALNSTGYPGWQIMTPGRAVEQQRFAPKDHQQQQQQQQQCSYLPDRHVSAEERRVCVGDPESKAISRPDTPASASHHGLTEIIKAPGSSHSGSAQDDRPQSPSPATGEKAYRCPLPGDYTSTQPASLGFHLERYHLPHWQDGRELPSPPQPPSTSPSPNPMLRPRSREDWSPAAGHYLGLETHDENALLVSKQPDLDDDDRGMTNSLPVQTRKSQYEPLDLSVRPDSAASHADKSPAALLQLSGVYGNGHSSSIITPRLQGYSDAAAEPTHSSSIITPRLQGYSDAAAEPTGKHAYQSHLIAQGAEDDFEIHRENAEYGDLTLSHDSTGQNGDGAFEWPESDREREEEEQEVNKWTTMKSENVPSEQEPGGEALPPPQEKLGQWGRDVTRSPIPPLEKFTPGQSGPLQQHRSLLSVLRSSGGLNSMPPNGHTASLNGGGAMEKEGASVWKPFQCRYCSYSASQKGNLKTHVLCVHRQPFDNSLYPDRRLRRSHVPQRPARLAPGAAGDAPTPGSDPITMTSSLCGT